MVAWATASLTLRLPDAPRAARYHFRASGVIRKKALAEAATDPTAHASTARLKPVTSGSPPAPSTPPSKAVATNPPVRAMALLKPEAEPVWRASTAPSTELVNGATAPAMPKEIVTTAG